MAKLRILGCGAALPQTCVTNDDLSKVLDTSDTWIRERTGITQRYVAQEGESTATLAFKACKEALAKAELEPKDVDIIILATSTPDDIFPSTATKVQGLLNAAHAVAFDIQAACSGYVFALETAFHFLNSVRYKTALVVGADTMSRIVDWTDRSTCVLFGDGAGAFVLQKAAKTGPKFLRTRIFSEGLGYDSLVAKHHVLDTGYGKISMNGREVYRHAVYKMVHAIKELEVPHLDWLIPHQANLRIIESVAKHLDFPMDRVVTTVQKHANTSAATIPLAYHEAHAQFSSGQTVAFVSMGAGFTWGSALIEL